MTSRVAADRSTSKNHYLGSRRLLALFRSSFGRTKTELPRSGPGTPDRVRARFACSGGL